MISQLSNARTMFANNTLNPRCLVVLDGFETPVDPILSVFDFGGWLVTWLDIHEPVSINLLASLAAIVNETDFVYLIVNKPTPLLLDIGYVFGLAKQLHKPVFIDYRGDAVHDDYPTTFKLADGVGFGVDDLSLFIDTFTHAVELSDFCTRARSVALKIKRLRMT